MLAAYFFLYELFCLSILHKRMSCLSDDEFLYFFLDELNKLFASFCWLYICVNLSGTSVRTDQSLYHTHAHTSSPCHLHSASTRGSSKSLSVTFRFRGWRLRIVSIACRCQLVAVWRSLHRDSPHRLRSVCRLQLYSDAPWGTRPQTFPYVLIYSQRHLEETERSAKLQGQKLLFVKLGPIPSAWSH